MPERAEDLRPLSDNDFRGRRFYLVDHVFFQAPSSAVDGGDRISERIWDSIVDLPTDVLLRTTELLGTMVEDMANQYSNWVHGTPHEPDQASYIFDATIDASDEFHASPFMAAHGWYRQATSSLRNALECMAIGAEFTLHVNQQKFEAWRNGEYEPKFGNMIDQIASSDKVKFFESKLRSGTVFGPNGVAKTLYKHLCCYAHARPGYTNVDIWNSNGPVFIGGAFTDFWANFGDTLALCAVLLKLSWDNYDLPHATAPLFEVATERWCDVALQAREAYFPH